MERFESFELYWMERKCGLDPDRPPLVSYNNS